LKEYLKNKNSVSSTVYRVFDIIENRRFRKSHK